MPFASHLRILALATTVAVGLALPARPAVAQPKLSPPSLTPKAPGVKPKQPGTAIFMSLSGTVLSYVLVLTATPASFVGAAGVIVGPSFGHWYAGRGNGVGILVRTTAATVFTLGVLRLFGTEGRDCLGATPAQCAEWEERWEREDRNTAIMVFGGLGVLAVSSAYDISTAGRSARQWNEAHGVMIAPVILPAAGGGAPGLMLGGRF